MIKIENGKFECKGDRDKLIAEVCYIINNTAKALDIDVVAFAKSAAVTIDIGAKIGIFKGDNYGANLS